VGLGCNVPSCYLFIVMGSSCCHQRQKYKSSQIANFIDLKKVSVILLELLRIER